MSSVHFYFHEITPDIPFPEEGLKQWIIDQCKSQHIPIEEIGFVFSHDEYLLQLNRNHLNHDYYTDIITFPYSYQPIHAEIYISLDRVKDNASTMDLSYEKEFLRVLAHGVLHMLGFKDHSSEEKSRMRNLEDLWVKSYYDQYA